MHGEAEILQDRVEVLPLDRRRVEAEERVGGDEDEDEEGARDPGLDAEDVRPQRVGQVAGEERHQGAEEGEDEHPQHHRAFVVSPYARELVEERHHRVRVLPDVEHREVGAHIGQGEDGEGAGDEREGGEGGDRGDAHQRGVAAARAEDRQARLQQRGGERQDQREMSEFDDHAARLLPFTVSPSRTPRGLPPSGCLRTIRPSP